MTRKNVPPRAHAGGQADHLLLFLHRSWAFRRRLSRRCFTVSRRPEIGRGGVEFVLRETPGTRVRHSRTGRLHTIRLRSTGAVPSPGGRGEAQEAREVSFSRWVTLRFARAREGGPFLWNAFLRQLGEHLLEELAVDVRGSSSGGGVAILRGPGPPAAPRFANLITGSRGRHEDDSTSIPPLCGASDSIPGMEKRPGSRRNPGIAPPP